MKNKKNKKEFSKVVVFVLGIVGIIVLVLSFHLMYLTHDLSPLMYVIPSTDAVVGLGISFYFWKAKTENKIKLMKQYKIKPTEEVFDEGEI